MPMRIAWIRLSEAAALLESCAACPPPARIVRADHGGYECVYCSTSGAGGDRRVAQLRRLHQDEWRRLLEACRRGEATAAACRAHLDCDVQAAIRTAVAAARYLEAAE